MTVYSFVQTQANVPYSFIVTPMSGDPDLYIYQKTAPSPLYPPPLACAQSVGTGVDVVEIVPDGLCSCATAPCTWFLGVVAYGGVSANFTVLVQNHTGPVQLNEGIAQFGAVSQGMSNFYSFNMMPGVTFMELSVSALFGDPDLYVCARARALAGGRRQLWLVLIRASPP
jgi:hypothetical protein